MRGTLPPRAYVAVAGAAGGLGLALLWLWVAVAPLAYLDREYPPFLAKRSMLDACDLGRVLILGDSRAASDIVPNLLPVPATNLAIGGGGPVEAYYLLRRALRCPAPPHSILLSFNAQHLSHADTFWERSVRLGLLEGGEAAEAALVSDALGDYALGEHVNDGLPDRVRAWLYRLRFPGFYAASVLRAGAVLRYAENRALLDAALRARGHYLFGTARASSGIAMEGWMTRFEPRPVLDRHLRALLRMASAAGIAVRFVAMPVNEPTFAASSPAMRAQFAAYLAALASEYPGVTVAPDAMPHWPDRFFGDDYSHLNEAGAALATARLARCYGEKDSEAVAACGLEKPPQETE